MSFEGQATFGNVEVEEASKENYCKKVMGVSNGSRIFCDNTAKVKISKGNGEVDYRCGMHTSDYWAILPDDF